MGSLSVRLSACRSTRSVRQWMVLPRLAGSADAAPKSVMVTAAMIATTAAMSFIVDGIYVSASSEGNAITPVLSDAFGHDVLSMCSRVVRRLRQGSAALRHFWLAHPDLDFHVDGTVHDRDGRYLAAADLAEHSRGIGVGDVPKEPVRAAFRALGEPYAIEMAEAYA